jgi:hypothetical protein
MDVACAGWKSVTVVGAGGVIGSRAVRLLARMPEVGRLTVVDPDRYEERNIGTHDIDRDAIGEWKVDVLARQIGAIDPTIEVIPHARRIEDLPLTVASADVLVSCPDSRRARQVVNQVAWRLGIPWADAGVDGGSALARVSVRVPSPTAACLECAWSPEDYAALASEYACAGRADGVRTGSPAWLGALAGALLVSECGRLLGARSPSTDPDSRQWVIDAGTRMAVMTHYRRSPSCLFDHRMWEIRTLAREPGELLLIDAFDLPAGSCRELAIEGHAFVRRLRCTECGQEREALVLSGRLLPGQDRCDECNDGVMEPVAFHDVSALDRRTVESGGFGHLTLADVGCQTGDVISLGETHFVLGVHHA